MTSRIIHLSKQWILLITSKILPSSHRQKFLSLFFTIPITGAFVAGLCLTLLFAACTPTGNLPTANTPSPNGTSISNLTQNQGKVVRFGYQKSTILLKIKGVLEKRLTPEGITINWTEFPAGPQLLEALNVGSIDIGPVGESPPIFAQAAGAELIYVAGIASTPASSAILLPQKSPIQKITDLKGKKIAFQKGSSAHYLLVQVLEKAGLKYEDIQPIYLPPADARAAFVKGSIDAWVIWDPFYAAAQEATKAKVLIDGTGITKQGGYYLTSRKFVTEKPEIVKEILEEVQKLELWSKDHRQEVAETLSPILGVDLATLKKANDRRTFGSLPITDDLIAEQQKVADTYYRLKLVPKQVNVKEATLTPAQYAAFSPKT